MESRNYIIPIFIPDLGCPNQCVFCSQKKITGQAQVPEPEHIGEKVKEYLATIPKEKPGNVEIAFYGGSFTAIPLQLQRRFLQDAWKFVRAGQVKGIRISTRPDKIDEEILSLLAAYQVDTIELGVQSMDADVLELAKRGHSPEDVGKSVQMIKSWGFFLGIQLMMGLPGDSQEKALTTCQKVINLKPDFVRLYPVLVLKGTELEEMLARGLYSPWSVEQTVDTAKIMLNRLERAGIDVIRIGLQNTEEISPAGEIAAGPYHPAMGELVHAALALEQQKILFDKAGLKTNDSSQVVIRISARDESRVRGHKSENLNKLKELYGLKSIGIETDKNLDTGVIKLVCIDGEPVELETRRDELIL